MMTTQEFEQLAQEVFDSLPQNFTRRIENVQIVVEDVPGERTLLKTRTPSRTSLLGLYEGVPLTRRGAHYGVYPVVPDKITLFRKNIESVASSDAAIREKVREVMIHEIAHYFGMTEEEIRMSGF
jgi:predicted Zn-dependent protease with MMP-like domain